ncbi:hypothetical protein IWQ60_012567, partial [Tieghemiomyces parasiticus]
RAVPEDEQEDAHEEAGQDDTPALIALREAVAEVLHLSLGQVGSRASFFRLGGDSISAIRLTS